MFTAWLHCNAGITLLHTIYKRIAHRLTAQTRTKYIATLWTEVSVLCLAFFLSFSFFFFFLQWKSE